MFASEMMETVGLNQCHACHATLRERDKFCRCCGVSQRLDAVVTDRTDRLASSRSYATSVLPGDQGRRRSFSAALVTLVTQSVAERTSPLHGNRWTMQLVGVLAVVPLWLMIALLSPLEAYVAAKSIATQE